MKKIIRRITSFSVVVSMLASWCVLSCLATDANNKSKLTILNNDITNMVYTYTENGDEYKVIESANDELTEIHTEIFVLNEESNEFEPVGTFDTMLRFDREQGRVTYTRIENGVSSQGIIAEFSDNQLSFSDISNSRAAKVGWVFAREYDTHSLVGKWTLLVVTGIIVGAVGAVATGAFNAGLVGGVEAIAMIVIEETWPKIYYTHYQSFFYVEGNSLPTHEEILTYVYSDEERTKCAGTTVYTSEILYHD